MDSSWFDTTLVLESLGKSGELDGKLTGKLPWKNWSKWETAYLSPPPLLPQPHTSPNLLSVDCCWDREGIGKVRSCSDADIDLEKEKESKQSSESWCD